MSYNFDFVKPPLSYVRKKAKSFLEKHNLADTYAEIEQSAKENMNSQTDYINRLLNDTVSIVAKKENVEWNKIRDEFNLHYLSND